MINSLANKVTQTDLCNIAITNGARKGWLLPLQDADTFISHNLLHFLKKKLRTIDEITNFVNNLSDNERYIGALPDKWRKSFDSKDIKEKTLEIQKILSDFAKRCSTPKQTPINSLTGEADDLAKKLKEYFGECKVTPFNSGSLGKVFKIECGGERLALKVYHNNPAENHIKNHGQTKEIANAVHLNKAMKPNRCSRFYCAKIGLQGDDDAFMLTEFVKPGRKELQIPHKKDLWKPERFYFGDSKYENFVGQKLVDYGSIDYNFNSVKKREYAKELYQLIYKGDTKGIKRMLKLYGCDDDFNQLVSEIKSFIQDEANYPLGFGVDAKSFTKKEIDSYKALGINFSKVQKFDYSNYEESKEAVIKAGLQKPDGAIKRFLHSLRKKLQS